MEKSLEHKLERWEHVHHINHNKLDNRLENLEVLSASEHGRIHSPEEKKPTLTCKWCGVRFRPRRSNGKPINLKIWEKRRFCSISCGAQHRYRR